MARPLRFVYPGAVYHVMASGDGGKAILITREDHLLFLHGLGRVCGSHGWRVHAWVLMRNHFHLLLETPEANLVSGMGVLLGSFAQAWNRRHQRRGHVFQGRYKSIPVTGERASDPYQFRVGADYIHLNPARAGLAGGTDGKLTGYEWSSLPAYQKGKGLEWLCLERVLAAFDLSQDGRGRRAYVSYLEKRAAENGGNLSDAAMLALRRGWYLGDVTFRDQLLKRDPRFFHEKAVTPQHRSRATGRGKLNKWCGSSWKNWDYRRTQGKSSGHTRATRARSPWLP